MLPSIVAKQLQKGIGDYIETTFPMTNEPFKGSIQKLLETKDAVYHEPYVAVRLPFRVAEAMPACFEAIHPAYLPYVHQQRAFERLTGEDGRSTLVATGTGSGKTECFLYPILEYCYQHRGERGIKALMIYPMNALASDQAKRIAELIYGSNELRGNVTVGMYVGGQEHTPARMMSEHGVITDHETMLNSAPDILMTNYKMLDYLLVRPKDALLWQDNDAETLKYIAVDELHTFDGAQGTDLACLLRRLKRRLGIGDGYLCCIGTSATMGAEENNGSILEYASEIFGEPFERDAVITEDRLSAGEFFAGSGITEFSMPTPEEAEELEALSSEDEPSAYLKKAAKEWFPDFSLDVMTDAGRIGLGKLLMHHSFMQSVINQTGGNYYQVSRLAEDLSTHYPELKNYADVSVVINSLFALISHARTGTPGKLRPFLFVQVQLWMRELRRLVAKVDRDEITYAIAHDLNQMQSRGYLPVVNCRDCGITGWVSILNERRNATMGNLEAFYNRYFKADDRIVMLFPQSHKNRIPDMMPGRLCPDCLQVEIQEGQGICSGCGAQTIEVLMPNALKITGTKEHQQFICPCCGSHRGLALMGLRSATEISASLSQMFASKFNDDKKTLAFSDSVQDAAHKAGFFNSRTWRFGLRTAIQRYCAEFGAGLSLADFQDGFIKYWHKKMSDEAFVSFFIAPNMTWKHAYEEMISERKLGKDKQTQILIHEIEQRLKYEIMLEYGLGGKIGRTLEKSGCSVLSFEPEAIRRIAKAVRERTVNELGELTSETEDAFCWMVAGYLNLMRCNGAFKDPVFDEFTKNNANIYMLSNDRNRWLPGLQSGRNTPRFIAEYSGKRISHYDSPDAKKYADWIKDCCSPTLFTDDSTYRVVCRLILAEAIKRDVIVAVPSPPEDRIYALNKQKTFISEEVVQMRCERCGTLHAVSVEEQPFWDGAPCQRANCCGSVRRADRSGLGYYGRLYTTGDLERINVREHTGLLERPDREQLEIDFKRGKDTKQLWDPNVLSCTPTLEMGIDIGDLSTVILCSMPPAQSQFLQRAGRAGRKDGNALTLAIANARPHDLYFYADPLDMISGNVTPPKVFLKASAVLERQFVAFCMDSWVKKGIAEGAIPEKVGTILNKLDSRPDDIFPFNFMHYVQNTLSRQLKSFMLMFAAYLDENTRQELQSFARGQGSENSPMYVKILDSFEDLKKQQDALRQSVDALKAMVKELEAKPKDSSYDEEIKELRAEETALISVLQELGKKNTFNFLSDEGLLPNYAFPEAGIVLRAVLYRKDEEQVPPGATPARRKFDKMVYEYSRSASSAISEFAPHNSFYVDGRKLTIDQVDLITAQSAKWRLCPSCSHAQLEESGHHVAACPHCGSPGWADSGQVRNMLKVQMVYSNMDYTRSLISDESDDRSNVFYCKQLLVDVDEDQDISSAYRMDNEDFPFGYEFVRKATLREINFGESDTIGESFAVSGVEGVRKGFRICKYCGKIQPEHGKPVHTYACKTRKMTSLMQADAYEECLFLYREFTTEVLRLLVPATTMDSTSVKLESFVAAFMLGMREYFGNVDHLRATVSEVPVPDADYRKQYLVIYDSVPGGTGYLKQLMHEENALIEIFKKALHVMEDCSCKDDPAKDGCYHCLYAYRQSQQIGNISRAAAVRMLKSILSGKARIEKIKRINDIPVNPLFDSELELRFIEAVRARVGAANVNDSIRNGKHSYYIKIDDFAWEIEPQVLLDAASGIRILCKPDFVFWPVSAPDHLPVAVFTDGFLYHKDIVADDTAKREAIRRSGRFRVWSLSFKDVQNVFAPQGDYATATLEAEKMPCGMQMYRNTVKKEGADSIDPAKLSSFDLLMTYLSNPKAERLFQIQADGYARSLLDPRFVKNKNDVAFTSWNKVMSEVNTQTHFTESAFTPSGSFFGTWVPRQSNAHLAIYAGVMADQLKSGSVAVCAVLHDEKDQRSDKYEQEWNGFLLFMNMMQFCKEFIAVSSSGLGQMAYLSLPVVSSEETAAGGGEHTSGNAWDQIMELLFDEDAKAFAAAAKEASLPAPEEDNIGFEVEGDDGEVMATVEIAWPDRKIGFLTAEQMEDKEKLEHLGWTIVDLFRLSDLAGLLGGKN